MNLTTEDNWLHFTSPNDLCIHPQTYKERREETPSPAEAPAERVSACPSTQESHWMPPEEENPGGPFVLPHVWGRKAIPKSKETAPDCPSLKPKCTAKF